MLDADRAATWVSCATLAAALLGSTFRVACYESRNETHLELCSPKPTSMIHSRFAARSSTPSCPPWYLSISPISQGSSRNRSPLCVEVDVSCSRPSTRIQLVEEWKRT